MEAEAFGYPSTNLSRFVPHCAYLSINSIFTMEDTLAIMWSNFSLAENEASTIVLDPSKLSSPRNVFVGKLAMRKYINIAEMEKCLRVIWGMANSLEVTPLEKTCSCLYSLKEMLAIESLPSSPEITRDLFSC